MLDKIELRPLTAIRPYWRNPRRISATAVAAVVQSIKQFGFNQPIVVDEDGVIIVGHTRYKALQTLGWEQAPVLVATHLDKKQAKAYRIADNKAGELSEWDNALLIPELRELGEDIKDLKAYFPHTDLDDFLREASGGVGFAPVSQGEVEQAQTKVETQFAERAQTARADFVEVCCPHCGGDFFVSKTDVAARPGVAQHPE